MNREKTKEAIAVMQAYVDGAEIQNGGPIRWSDIGPNNTVPAWNWTSDTYRIKPKYMYVRPMDLHTHAPNGECEQTGCIKVIT